MIKNSYLFDVSGIMKYVVMIPSTKMMAVKRFGNK